MRRCIYMDNHATTRVDPRVMEAMQPFFTERYGNAASKTHAFGWDAEEACEAARRQVAAILGARAKEIIFTSGATESNNLAITGAVDFYADRGDHIVTVTTEHKAVLDVVRALEKQGRARSTVVAVGRDGMLDPAAIEAALTDRTVLVSVMLANNEIGVLHDLREIASRVRARGVLLHTDATQAVGKVAVDVEGMGIDLLSCSAHKMYGPKGIGALYVRAAGPRVRLAPLFHGGGHERGLRSGTLNVPGVIGFGEACRVAAAEMAEEQTRIRVLRDRLWHGLSDGIEDVALNGDAERRLAGNLNVRFAYVEGESLLVALEDIAVSSGSACTSATLEPSHVLRAIGLSDEQAHQSLRFGLGRFNTEEEVDRVIHRVGNEVRRLRRLSPGYRAAQRRESARV